jgi:hypothetical protein
MQIFDCSPQFHHFEYPEILKSISCYELVKLANVQLLQFLYFDLCLDALPSFFDNYCKLLTEPGSR